VLLIYAQCSLGRCCCHEIGWAWQNGCPWASALLRPQVLGIRGINAIPSDVPRTLISAVVGCYAARNTHIASVPCTTQRSVCRYWYTSVIQNCTSRCTKYIIIHRIADLILSTLHLETSCIICIKCVYELGARDLCPSTWNYSADFDEI
jgi:hypothetical protein